MCREDALLILTVPHRNTKSIVTHSTLAFSRVSAGVTRAFAAPSPTAINPSFVAIPHVVIAGRRLHQAAWQNGASLPMFVNVSTNNSYDTRQQ